MTGTLGQVWQMLGQQRTLDNRYRLQKRLGVGGQGEVFAAHDVQLDRTVAVKRLHRARDAAARQRFLREANTLASLNHPHIIEIFGRFESDGDLYQVMAFADSGSLTDLLAKGQNRHGLPLDQVVAIGLSLASALQTAHAAGVTHRDIKPSNVLFLKAADGFVVKLADFGIANVASAEDALTRTGEWVGTLANMAPEQVRGYPADAKSDVYALGVLLYRLALNRHYVALEGDEMARRQAILSAKPEPLRTVRPSIPAALSELVDCMLEKQPQKRPSAAHVYNTLRSLDQQHPAATMRPTRAVPHVGPKTPRRRRPWLIVAPALAAILGFVLVLVLPGIGLQTPPVPPVPAVRETVEAVVEQAEAFVATQQAALPDWPGPGIGGASDDEAGDRDARNAEPVTAVVTNTAPAAGLRLRAAPDLSADIITILPDGTEVLVLAFRDYESWALVDAGPPHGEGWVFAEFIRLESETTDQP